MSRHLTKVVFTAWKQILRRDMAMRVILEHGLEPKPAGPEPYVQLQIEGDDGFFTVGERSLGFRWFFVFLLLTTFRGYRRDTKREMLYLLDEPASNLHPSAQTQLLTSLQRVAERSRVIYTTHSQHLVNPDWLENTFVVRNGALDRVADLIEVAPTMTDIAVEKYRAFAASHPDQSQYFQPILEVLDYSPSRLEMVPELVLVEGKNDFYTIRLSQTLFGVDDLHAYPGGGAGTLDDVIGLYTAWGRNFVVMLDSDSEGLKQRGRYLERFGALVEDRILTLDDLVPKLAGSPLDAVFGADDLVGFSTATGYTADALSKKKVFYRALQEVVASRKPVHLHPDTTAALNSLVIELRSRLSSLRGS